MIVFDLKCSKEHTFEGWFEDGSAYKDQSQKGLISCPVCDDKEIVKIPSTFAIKGSSMAKNPAIDEHRALLQLGQEISNYVEKNFDNVGCDFTKEALKIHYGASEPRNIRGISTKEEEKTLKKEGIQFFKIPAPPSPESEPES
jgi:hypothetical protein